MSAEVLIRVTVFLGALVALSALERRWPLRARGPAAWRHAGRNLGLAVCNALILRLSSPLLAISAAFYAQRADIGLANWLDLRLASAFVVSLLALDFALYLQHLALHAVTPLWRLHRVHHSDAALDATTGVRFHPLEALLSMLYKSLIVILLGAPPAAVVLFELLLNVSSLFNHANLSLPPRLDKALRSLIVTPAMHWVHHSVVVEESQRNFGFCLSTWDRLFGTYLARPRRDLAQMRLGVAGIDDHGETLWRLLGQPFRMQPRDTQDYRLGHGG